MSSNSPIRLGLPTSPLIQNHELVVEFQIVYNALRILQQVLDDAGITPGTSVPTSVIDVPHGGTNVSTLTGLARGNGTAAFTAITSSTVGQVLRVTGADAFTFGAVDLADTDAVTGLLPAINLSSATYTPTITGVTNVAASTARLCTWTRIGSMVIVSGQLDIDPTAVGNTNWGVSLPVASALTTVYQLGGAGATNMTASQGVLIQADVANGRADFFFTAASLVNQTVSFTFGYQVL